MGGRKPLPTQVKQIKGTLQPCRTNYHEPICKVNYVIQDGDNASEHLLM